MIQKKVCMLGASAVGKTSLVARFVQSIFSDKYLTTVGVKIDKKIVNVEDQQLTFMLWDLAGEDEFLQIRMSYLRGTSGYLLVADGTRRATLDKALDLHSRVEDELGEIPFILLLNKSDLTDEWEIEDGMLQTAIEKGWTVYETSAKTGDNVEEAFFALAEKMLKD